MRSLLLPLLLLAGCPELRFTFPSDGGDSSDSAADTAAGGEDTDDGDTSGAEGEGEGEGEGEHGEGEGEGETGEDGGEGHS